MNRLLLSLFLLFPSAFLFSQEKPSFWIKELKTEYLQTPIGLDAPQPRFTWKMENHHKGAAQQAYRLLVDQDSLELVKGNGRLWNSGWQNDPSQLVSYKGAALKAFTRYYWRVEVSDQRQKGVQAAISYFETGLLDSPWQGAWISDRENMHVKPAPYFRRAFRPAKKVIAARAYIAVAGLYELSINGKKIGNHRLDPTYTRFDRRLLYVTHDVTAQLQSGDNVIGVLLGNGWYNHQSTAVWNFDKANWRNRPTFCLDLRLTYEDGSIETIRTDKEWKTSLSPLIFNSIYTAEHYDSRLEQKGWDEAGFEDKDWKTVIYRPAPANQIVAQALHPIRNVQEINAKSIRKINDTTYLFDIGRNISGVSQLSIQGPAGTKIRLKHAERLGADGRVDLSNIDLHYRPKDDTDPFQTDVFILHGKGLQQFMPRFNYKGFQYVEVSSSVPLKLDQGSLKAYFMHSDVPVAGKIKASDPLLEKIADATNNSYLSNLFGYPTDCPQREKNGWTGDAAIAVETGLYNFDAVTIYEKWMADHRDEQQPNGVLPSIIPTHGWGYEWGNGPDWTSTIAIIPWSVYLFYGDLKILKDCYEPLKKYVNYIHARYPSGLTSWGLGDWVPVKSKASVELTSTCYYYADVVILAKSAKLLGHTEDEKYYTALAENIKSAFNAKFLNTETGIYHQGLQTEQSVPLFWGIVPEESRQKVADQLASRVEADHFQLDVGLLGTKAILNALSEYGYPETAYRLASRKTYPGWGWWIENGATTLYENWDIQAKADISLNHIMFGEIGAWLFKSPGGIKPDEKQPGFKNVVLQPQLMGNLQHFEARHESPYGTIVSRWEKTKKGVLYTFEIPPGSTATVVLPLQKGQALQLDGQRLPSSTFQLTSGRHQVTAHSF